MGLELLPRPRTWPVTTGDCPRAVTACSVSILPGTLRLCPHPLLAGGCDDPGPPLSYDVLNSVAEEALGSPPDPASPILCPCTCTVLFDGQQASGEPVSQAIRKAISQPGPGSQTSVLGRIAWRACSTQISTPGPGTMHSLGRRALREAAWHPATHALRLAPLPVLPQRPWLPMEAATCRALWSGLHRERGRVSRLSRKQQEKGRVWVLHYPFQALQPWAAVPLSPGLLLL